MTLEIGSAGPDLPMKFICCSIVIRNKHASFARFVYIRILLCDFFLFRVKSFSHIVIVCVVFLTLVSCFNNIKILIQNQNPRSSCPIEKYNSPSNSDLSSGVLSGR